MKLTSFDPFWRSSVGFDRVFDLLDDSLRTQTSNSYPPYNIAKTGNDAFRISLAVPGFRPDQMSVVAHQNTLTVAGRTDAEPDGSVTYLHRGIAGTPFECRFSLADFVEVTNASFHDGVLDIDLERRVPDAMKPRRIEVKSAAAASTALESNAA